MPQLKDGDLFPPLQAHSLDHGAIDLPAGIPAGNYALVLVYRAHW